MVSRVFLSAVGDSMLCDKSSTLGRIARLSEPNGLGKMRIEHDSARLGTHYHTNRL